MRKLVLLPLALCLWLGWGLYGEAQEDETRALIDKAIKAQGGAKALAAIKAVQIKGKGKMYEPIEGSFTVDVSSKLPDKVKAQIEVEAGGMTITVIEVYNGTKGWRSIQGKTEKLGEKEIKEAKEKFHVEKVTSLIALRDKAYKLSPLGEMKVDDNDAVGVQVTKKGFRDVNLYFDKKTHRLVKAEYRTLDPMGQQEVSQEKFYSDYKKLPSGSLQAMKMHLKNDGKKFLDIEVTEMTTSDDIDDSVFAKP